MIVPVWLWVASITGILLVMLVDLVIVDRSPHAFGPKAATRWVIFYVSLAMLFCLFVTLYFGPAYGGQFLSGYLLEYSLSVDNLFVFLVIMTSFAVPAVLQHRVLLIGVLIALMLRAVLILLGAELIERFTGTFFLFGAFLLYTAYKVWHSNEEAPDPEGNGFMRFMGRHLPTSSEYDGTKLFTRAGNLRALTPMALVMLAIGTTDVMFALDSIPAVFGVTTVGYLVLMCNAFALMGLRQLYFLLQGFLDRLCYLSRGLGVILSFVGAKMLLEALGSTTSIPVPSIPVWFSLLVIVLTLTVTAVTSLRATSDRKGLEPEPETPGL